MNSRAKIDKIWNPGWECSDLYKQNLRGISLQHSPYQSRRKGAGDILKKSNS